MKVVAFIVVLAGLMWLALHNEDNRNFFQQADGWDINPSAPNPEPPAIIITEINSKIQNDTVNEKQAERAAIILGYKEKGYIYKVEQRGILPHVFVTRQFMALPLDVKRAMMSVFFAYYSTHDEKASIVVIKKAITGDKIGIFTEYGLKMY